MTMRLVYPASPEQKLSNSRNLFFVGGAASAAAAKTYAEVMANVQPGTMDAWACTDLADSASYSFVAGTDGLPVGRAGSPWATLNNGDPLPAA